MQHKLSFSLFHFCTRRPYFMHICLTPNCCYASYQFTPFHVIFGVTPFGWLLSILLTSYFWWECHFSFTPFWFMSTFTGTQLACKTSLCVFTFTFENFRHSIAVVVVPWGCIVFDVFLNKFINYILWALMSLTSVQGCLVWMRGVGIFLSEICFEFPAISVKFLISHIHLHCVYTLPSHFVWC